jgi:tetratricopeptide (TPR) repeat protein
VSQEFPFPIPYSVVGPQTKRRESGYSPGGGPRCAFAAQLVDATSGVHLWAESYERTFRPEAVFEIPDDVAPRIVSTVGDGRGVLPRNISEALRNKDPLELSPYEAVLRSFAHFQRVSAEEHAPARAALERASQLAPGHADCWAMLSLIYKEEYTHGFNIRPDPLGRAFAAAQRAIEAAPSNHLAYHALASVLYFQKEFQAFRSAAERAIALNPMDGFTIAYLGFLTAYSGDWERGCALVQRARSLNPHHPGWYWFADLFDAYRNRDYRRAVEIGLKINMPSFWRTSVALAAAYGQIGEMDASRHALQTLLTLHPNFARMAREELAKWWDPELVEHLIDGLRKAGLEIPSETGTPRAKPVVETGS